MVTEKEHEAIQKEYFNRICYEWNKNFDSKREEQDRLVAEMGLRGDERILDVATGIGVMVPSYLKYLSTGSVLAIDYSENMISVAKERFPEGRYGNVRFETMNLYDLDREGEFDLAVCYSCFPHLYDHDRAVEVLAHSLKMGGRLAICSLRYNRVADDGGEEHRRMAERMPEHRFMTVPQLLTLCERYGLTLAYAANTDDRSLIVVRRTGREELV